MRNLMIVLVATAAVAACGPGQKENSENSTDNAATNSTMNNSTMNNSSMNNSTMNNSTMNNSSMNNSSSNNQSTNNQATNNQSTNNSTNNQSTNNSTNTNNTNNTNNGGGTESEPNDSNGEANALTFGESMSGQLAAGGDDVDVFSVSATGGTILEVEVLSTNANDFEIDLLVTDSTGTLGERFMGLNANSQRQFFVPEDDTYYVDISPLAQSALDYEFVVREVTPSPITDDFADTVSDDLDDGDVDVYAVPAADGEVLVALDADRLTNASDLDSWIIIYNPNAGLVAENDDVDQTTYDSELTFNATANETYWLVVDAYEIATNNAYELTVALP